MLTSEFSYILPEQAISKIPAEPRHSARLLVSRDSTERIDSTVLDLSDFLNSGDLLVVNNTKVLPARIPVTRQSGGSGEIFLLHRIDEGLWNALVKPNSKIEVGDIVHSKIGNYSFEVGRKLGEGHRVIKFIDVDEQTVLNTAGQTPLPPYLGDVEIDLERYQTMFADIDQSVAAPTAGLHFTPELVEKLRAKDIEICEVTLHVGVGTFRPIKTENIEDHVMHEEKYEVTTEVWEKIQSAKDNGNKVIAVGTTSLRTLESVAKTGELGGSTDLYCYGKFPFAVVDSLFTNFHQPQSSLLVLLDSFMGERWRELYEYALSQNYRFLSFGDAMLVSKRND